MDIGREDDDYITVPEEAPAEQPKEQPLPKPTPATPEKVPA